MVSLTADALVLRAPVTSSSTVLLQTIGISLFSRPQPVACVPGMAHKDSRMKVLFGMRLFVSPAARPWAVMRAAEPGSPRQPYVCKRPVDGCRLYRLHGRCSLVSSVWWIRIPFVCHFPSREGSVGASAARPPRAHAASVGATHRSWPLRRDQEENHRTARTVARPCVHRHALPPENIGCTTDMPPHVCPL